MNIVLKKIDMNDDNFLKLQFFSDKIFRVSLWKSCYAAIGKKSNNKWMASINS